MIVSSLAHREASLTSNSQPALCFTVIVVGHPQRVAGKEPLTWRLSHAYMSISYGSEGEGELELLSTPGKGGIFLHGSNLSGLPVTGSGETH